MARWAFRREQKKTTSLFEGIPKGAADDDGTIIVVGAGAAGLTAARVLQDQGRKVFVVEGRERIGGRLHTINFGGGIVDEGGNWIHGVPENPLYHLVTEAGIATKKDDIGHPLRLKVFDSKAGRTVNIVRSLYMLWKATRLSGRLSHEDLSVNHPEANLSERFENEVAGMQGEMNQRLFRYGLRAVVDLTMAEKSEVLHPNALAINPDYENAEDVTLEGGYRQLIERLAIDLDIRLGNAVVEIRYDENGVTIVTDQETYQGSHVIVTVPLGVLKSNTITFNPPLPEEKTQAIKNLGFGNVEKVFLKFPTPFWRSSPQQSKHLFHISETVGDFPAFLDLTDKSGQPILAALLSGDQSRQLAADAEPLIERATEILQEMFPEDYQQPTAVHVTNWQKDRFAGGSYSTPVLSTSPENYEQLATPVAGRVLFAGEATYREHGGFVEGAMGSGVREARRILGQEVDLVLRNVGQ